jgi:hypothetical protein
MFPGFDGLMTLSRREGVDIRPTLLRVLTDLYVQASTHSIDEERQFVELASRLIDQVDDATRAAVRARLAIYPRTPVAIMQKLRFHAAAPDQRVPLAASIALPVAPAAEPKPLTETQMRMSATMALQPTDAAEISGMFFAGTASERAQMLHSLSDTPLKPAARIPESRAARALHILEMAAFAEDRGNFARELGDALLLPSQVADRVVSDPGGEPLACMAKGHVSARTDFPQSRTRLVGPPRVPAVAALRYPERTLGADHGRGMARRQHGCDPHEVPPRAL